MSLTISLTPDQVERRMASLGVPCHFTEQERSAFATTPIVSGSGGVFGFPTPVDNGGLSLRNIRARVGVNPKHQPSFFDHPWYETEGFMNVCCPSGWHFLFMDVLPDSVGASMDYAGSLVARGFELPKAVEIVLMLFLHYVDSGEQLLLRKHTWCAETASLSRSVTVGAFGRNGVFLSGHPTNFSSRGLGICPRIVVS